MDEGRGLERVPGGFSSHLVRGHPAQLLIHQREQFLGSLGVAALRPVQNACEVAHAPTHSKTPGPGTARTVRHLTHVAREWFGWIVAKGQLKNIAVDDFELTEQRPEYRAS